MIAIYRIQSLLFHVSSSGAKCEDKDKNLNINRRINAKYHLEQCRSVSSDVQIIVFESLTRTLDLLRPSYDSLALRCKHTLVAKPNNGFLTKKSQLHRVIYRCYIICIKKTFSDPITDVIPPIIATLSCIGQQLSIRKWSKLWQSYKMFLIQNEIEKAISRRPKDNYSH